jgi:Glycine zipper
MSHINPSVRYTVATLIVLSLVACATQPPPRPQRQARVAQAAPPPPPPVPVDTNLYSYPTKGQSAERHDRDRYECHMWAVKQSGFDPSLPNIPPQQRVQLVGGPPPGVNTAAGAVTGAAIGAAVSNYGHQAGGAIVGAVLGGALGATADAANAEEKRRTEDRINAREAQQAALWDQKASGYRRAATACLEGRGYNVR